MDQQTSTETTALYASSSSQNRNRYNKRFTKPKNPPNNPATPVYQNTPSNANTTARPTCQICGKIGHVALNCWHRCNLKYAPTDSRQPRALLAHPTSTSPQDWIVDSGASTHLTPDVQNIQYPTHYQGFDSVSVANGTSLPIQHSGQGLLPLPDTSRKLRLQNLLHVPNLKHNLLSVSKLTTDNSVSITFDANGFLIKDIQDQRPLLHGRLHNELYQVQLSPDTNSTALSAITKDSVIWHARLGHPNNQILSALAKCFPEISSVPSSFICSSCNMAKSHKQVFNKSFSVTTAPFDLLHTDVWGPASVPSVEGFRYYIVFVDDYTRFSWLYFMHTKQEVLSKFQSLCNYIKTQFNSTPKTLRSDGGGEFIGNSFKSFLQQHGIQQQFSCPHTPEQNGLAERKHRHLLDLTRALLHASNLPHKFWADATSTAHYLINRLPSKSISLQIPFQRLHGKSPTYTHLRTFGCLCFPWMKSYAPNKFAPRSQECIFLGYSPQHKGYKCYILKTGKSLISRHVVFYETQFPFQSASSTTNTSSPSTNNYTPPLLLTPYTTSPTLNNSSHTSATQRPSHSSSPHTSTTPLSLCPTSLLLTPTIL
ncbi:Retrovirus-related Pol polyprotein from transposon TNT 1-94 [Dendrobium catenatum]|uniref:Retrovirus-related Pol polyprotein from transposon TNT 1-94 n=1 Tax=Dendrobium catenatum TaxID=906689 RepID=A0A2I0W7X4_9ASPA|nr:Retrovirus-related Pol polyprotein from transposon TNT 1-94 [Dendrobium catenatum]